MTTMAALWTAVLAAATVVQGVRVNPAGDRTEVVVEVDGVTTVTDFVLSEPDRLVVDLADARHTLDRTQFTDIDRGGVRGIRIGQYTPDVVRVVIDLVRPTEYEIEVEGSRLRILFPNPYGPFEPWQAGVVSSAPVRAPAPSEPPAAGVEPAIESGPQTAPSTVPGRDAVGPVPGVEPVLPPPLIPAPQTVQQSAPLSATSAMAAAPTAQATAAPIGAAAPAPAAVPEVAAPVSPPVAAAPVLAFAQTPVQEAQRITVAFRDVPLLDVLATFAEFSGRSIVPGSDISGTVNASIDNQPWDVALESILNAHGLAIRETESGILRVDRLERLREREQLEDLITVPFQIKFASVDSIAPAVEGLISSRGSVTRNRSTNTLIVTDGRSVVENRIAPMIQQLDVQTPQVNVSAKIIFIDRTALQELGIIYDLKDSRGNQLNNIVTGLADLNGDGVLEPTASNVVLLGGNSIAALGNASIRVAQPQLQLVSSLVLNRYSLITFIEALGQTTLSEIQASPTVTVLANREAVVQVGERTPIRVIDAGATTTGDASQAPRATVNIQETGIILRVTPYVVGDQVLLDLRAENSRVAAAPSDIGFTFSTQLSQTQVLVNDGETTVIGGLTVVEKGSVRAGIPLLMDIPVLGALFRTSREVETKRDLLIMVTPHIIRQGAE